MKIKALLLICFLSISGFCVDKNLDLYDFSGGLVDSVSPERLAIKYSPDMCNVNLDSDSGIVMRKEYIKYNPIPLTGLQQVLSTYDYRQYDGDEYFLAQSSNTLGYSTTGSFVTIKSTFTLNQRLTYETFLDKVWGGNGVDNEWSWDGTNYIEYTVSNSTNMVKAKIHALYKNRMFRAGVTGFPLTLYYSNINVTAAGAPDPNPADMGNGTNWEFISAPGDFITGIKPSADGSYLYIFTRYTTYALIGDSPSNWRLQCVSPTIGCLYNSTIDYVNGNIMLMSARGLEQFDGQNYKLVSQSIDKQIKKLNQLNVNQLSVSQDTAADWGGGSGVNIDTNTYSGSVAMSATVDVSSGIFVPNVMLYSTDLLNYKYRQQLKTSNTNVILNKIKLNYWRFTGTSGNVKISFCDSLMNVLVSSTVNIAQLSSDSGTGKSTGYPWEFSFSNTTLTSNSTYYIVISSDTGYSPTSYYFGFSCLKLVSNNYPNCNLQFSTYSSSGWDDGFYDGSTGSDVRYYEGVGSYCDLNFMAYMYNPTTGQYTTSALNAPNWKSWGNISIDHNIPTGSSIDYYYVTSTSVANLATNPISNVVSGGVINSTVGPYIKIISSFTRTNPNATPMLNSYIISYIGTNSDMPTAKTYQDAYYIAVATDSTTGINNVVYRFNKNGIFELLNNIYAFDFSIYRSELYFGSSQNTGQIYKMDIGSTYSDDIGAYTAYYKTPIMDCGNPIVEKSFKSLWITSSADTLPFTVQYKVDGSTATWNNLTTSPSSTRINTQKLNFPASTRGRYIQIYLSSNQYFNIRGMTLIYEELPLQ